MTPLKVASYSLVDPGEGACQLPLGKSTAFLLCCKLANCHLRALAISACCAASLIVHVPKVRERRIPSKRVFGICFQPSCSGVGRQTEHVTHRSRLGALTGGNTVESLHTYLILSKTRILRRFGYCPSDLGTPQAQHTHRNFCQGLSSFQSYDSPQTRLFAEQLSLRKLVIHCSALEMATVFEGIRGDFLPAVLAVCTLAHTLVYFVRLLFLSLFDILDICLYPILRVLQMTIVVSSQRSLFQFALQKPRPNHSVEFESVWKPVWSSGVSQIGKHPTCLSAPGCFNLASIALHKDSAELFRTVTTLCLCRLWTVSTWILLQAQDVLWWMGKG